MTQGHGTDEPGSPLGFPDDGLYDLLWQVTARTHLMAEESLVGTPLTAASGSMLAAIVAEPGMSVAEISRRIPKTQQTISQVIGRLQKLGLVERRLREGRGIALHATAAGVEMVSEVNRREAQIDAHLHDVLGPDRAQRLTDLLRQARTLLAQFDGEGERSA